MQSFGSHEPVWYGVILPEELGDWNSVHRQFRRWTVSGLWKLMLQALAEGGVAMRYRWSIAPGSSRGEGGGLLQLLLDGARERE
jgi:hypothetical protein